MANRRRGRAEGGQGGSTRGTVGVEEFDLDVLIPEREGSILTSEVPLDSQPVVGGFGPLHVVCCLTCGSCPCCALVCRVLYIRTTALLLIVEVAGQLTLLWVSSSWLHNSLESSSVLGWSLCMRVVVEGLVWSRTMRLM